MWPILLLTYYRLAKKEEKAMEEEFGSDYSNYKKSSGMFFPRIR
jgi:protein-S-isoprenylcysteine O-methyltransferase Ste14